MDELLKQKIITFLSLYSTNVGEGGIQTVESIEKISLDQVDRIFAHFEEDIFDTIQETQPEKVNTPSAKSPDQYQGNDIKTKSDKPILNHSHDLIERTGRNGAFLGCKSYPRCQYTEPIN